MGGTEGAREFECGFVAVDDNDRCSADRGHHLDADVSEATGADHEDEVARFQKGGRFRHDVVGCQPCVSESRDVLRLELVVELDHGAGSSLEVLGIATVDIDSRKKGGFAVDIVAEAAGFAEPAGDQWVQDDFIPDLDVRHRVPDGMNPACVFVADLRGLSVVGAEGVEEPVCMRATGLSRVLVQRSRG